MNGLLPPATEHRLDPATSLVVIPWRRLPLVHLHIHLDGGTDLDPAGREGTAQLTAELLAAGAGPRDRAAFARLLDETGASLHISPTRRATFLTLGLPAEALSAGVALLTDILVRPRLEEEEWTKIRRRARQDAVMLRENDPGTLAALAGRAWLYGVHHPDGRLETGDEASLGRVRRDDAARLHQQLLKSPRRWVLAIGDAAEDEHLRAARTLVEALAPASPPSAPPPPPNPPATPILLLDRPGSHQAYLWLGHAFGPEIMNEDPLAVELARATLGGHFLSLLNRRLRVELGLTYGAHASWQRSRWGGWTAVATYTASEALGGTLAATFDLLDAVAEDGPASADLETTRRYLTGQHAFGFETPTALARRFEAIVEGLRTREHDEEYAERLAALSPPEVARLARTYWPRRERFRLCVVGDATTLRPVLEPYGAPRVHTPGPKGIVPADRR